MRLSACGFKLRLRAGGDDVPAEPAGAGTDVDDVVGAGDRVLVVLDDQQGVALVAQVLERIEQDAVVARMQADGRFVEHVAHALQVRAQLAGQPDALRLAAGQRRCAAVERQVGEADVDQEAQPRRDLGHDVAGDLGFASREGDASRASVRSPRSTAP